MNVESRHPLGRALVAQSELYPDARTAMGPVETGWITADALFHDVAAIEEYLQYEGSFNEGVDDKTRAAFLINDYCVVYTAATVPLVLSTLVPDLAPARFALHFHMTPLSHDGEVHEVRRAHVRFLSPRFETSDPVHGSHADAGVILTREELHARYRRASEDHFRPLIEVLHRRTGLARSALWRLVADALAGRFLDAGRRLGLEQQAIASATLVLKAPGSPLNNRQLHFFQLSVDGGAGCEAACRTFRARGGCCRYYLVEGGSLCSTCVLRSPQERKDVLHAALRHRAKQASTKAS